MVKLKAIGFFYARRQYGVSYISIDIAVHQLIFVLMMPVEKKASKLRMQLRRKKKKLLSSFFYHCIFGRVSYKIEVWKFRA